MLCVLTFQYIVRNPSSVLTSTLLVFLFYRLSSLPSSYHPLLQSTLAPYHAIAPKELLRRAKIVEGFQETFVLDIKKRRPKVAALEVSRVTQDASRLEQN